MIIAAANFPTDGKELFRIEGLGHHAPQSQFTITADGQKFLIAKPVGEDTSAPITVVLTGLQILNGDINWRPFHHVNWQRT